jgi:RsiW-degrading membrane proteinase PrsW (M82 family)
VATVQDKSIIPLHKPSLNELLFFFISGIISSVPLTLFVNNFADYLLVALPQFYATVLSVAIFAPFIEEFAKAFPLFYRHGETERSIFTLGLLAGLGFGVFEFLTYVIALGVPIPFRLPGLFFHAASTSITAYGIANKRTMNFYLIAVALHFLNNFSALFGLFGLTGTVAIVAIACLISLYLYFKTSEKLVVY